MSRSSVKSKVIWRIFSNITGSVTDNTATNCGKVHSRPQDQKATSDSGSIVFEKLLRDMVIQWSLSTQQPERLGSLLAHYGRLIISEDKTMFREVLDQMIEEKREQGGSHESK